MSIWRYLAIGYLFIVLLGSALLVLPFASYGDVSYIDALFTSASAACVTGLVPFDTATHWTLFGQIVILLLIQTGGLGFTTFVSVLFLWVKGGLGLYEKNAVMRSLGGGNLRGVRALVKRIFIGTFVFELVGAAMLCIRFVPDFGGKGVWYALFHSVSAFCNAGFDILGSEWGQGSSLAHYATDPLVMLTVCVLIIIGGLGFVVWGDIWDRKFNFKKCNFYTKFILIVTGILLLVSTGGFLLFERASEAYDGLNFGQRLLVSFFNATTARTAGFSTVDLTKLSDSGYLLMIVLMFIGGCSGSTAGGIKVGTFAVIIMGMISALRGQQDINIGRRRVAMAQLWQALAVFISYLTLILVATMTICTIEPAGFREVLFETVSALGTVGLSLSLTGALGIASKIILILLMYMGRAGVLTIALAMGRKKTSAATIKRPVDTIFIG